jgi:hypothetical protein
MTWALAAFLGDDEFMAGGTTCFTDLHDLHSSHGNTWIHMAT